MCAPYPHIYVYIEILKSLNRFSSKAAAMHTTFSTLSDEKAGIFDGLQLKTLSKDRHFVSTMSEAKAKA